MLTLIIDYYVAVTDLTHFSFVYMYKSFRNGFHCGFSGEWDLLHMRVTRNLMLA